MKTVPKIQGWRTKIFQWGIFLTASMFAVFLAATTPQSAHALTTVPTKMNFQGRITNAAGTALTNGTYNMRFKIYNAATAGTLQWSEDRLVSASQGVVVTNGQFSVQLGSVTSLPASIFNSSSLYFEVELPTPASATTSSPVWTELPMTPRNQLATSAYAYNAETLDGLDSADFGQLVGNNTWTGTQGFNGATFSIAGTANANKFNVSSIFNVDSSSSIITIGAVDANATVLVVDTKNTTGDPTGTSATNGAMYYNSNAGKFRCYEGGGWKDCISAGGGNVSTTTANTFTNTNTIAFTSATAFRIQNTGGTTTLFTADTSASTVTIGNTTDGIQFSASGRLLFGTARGTQTVTLTPEYAGATFKGDGTNNVGSLSSDFCSATTGGLSINTAVCATANEEHNYYEWANTQATAQDYDIYVRYKLPSDYSTGSMTNLKFEAQGTTATESAVLTMYSSGTQCASTGDVVTTATTWSSITVASPLGTCTPAANAFVTFKITLTASQNNSARSGEITYTYRTTF